MSVASSLRAAAGLQSPPCVEKKSLSSCRSSSPPSLNPLPPVWGTNGVPGAVSSVSTLVYPTPSLTSGKPSLLRTELHPRGYPPGLPSAFNRVSPRNKVGGRMQFVRSVHTPTSPQLPFSLSLLFIPLRPPK